MSQNPSIMIARLKFIVDHVGVAVPTLEDAIDSNRALFGYNLVSGPFEDPIQKVRVAFLGSNCDVAHRVTIGTSAMGRSGAPVLGDDVYIGTGATLVGKIKIGDGAKIAANTLVITNVPAGSVMGVPGRVVSRPPKPVSIPTAVGATDAK